MIFKEALTEYLKSALKDAAYRQVKSHIEIENLSDMYTDGIVEILDEYLINLEDDKYIAVIKALDTALVVDVDSV